MKLKIYLWVFGYLNPCSNCVQTITQNENILISLWIWYQQLFVYILRPILSWNWKCWFVYNIYTLTCLHFRNNSPSRQQSMESRQYSVESTPGISSTSTKRAAPSPPLSPTRLQFRKKFRRMSGGGSSSGKIFFKKIGFKNQHKERKHSDDTRRSSSGFCNNSPV